MKIPPEGFKIALARFNAREAEGVEPFDPSVYERPVPPPVLRDATVVHLVQIIHCATGSGSMSSFVTWCGGRPVAAAFDPRVATCPACLRELHEAVSQ